MSRTRNTARLDTAKRKEGVKKVPSDPYKPPSGGIVGHLMQKASHPEAQAASCQRCLSCSKVKSKEGWRRRR